MGHISPENPSQISFKSVENTYDWTNLALIFKKKKLGNKSTFAIKISLELFAVVAKTMTT